MHSDLGPLGTAINRAAIRHQIEILKDMGCNAIRTSHNPPAPELVELCDEMGVMMMIEILDEWNAAKVGNGYHKFFNDWHEKDVCL
jgi:beta-galactosidase